MNIHEPISEMSVLLKTVPYSVLGAVLCVKATGTVIRCPHSRQCAYALPSERGVQSVVFNSLL